MPSGLGSQDAEQSRHWSVDSLAAPPQTRRMPRNYRRSTGTITFVVLAWLLTGCSMASSPNSNVPSAGPTSSTSTASGPTSSCDVVPSSGVRITVTSGTCSLAIHAGEDFHLALNPSLRWRDLKVADPRIAQVLSVDTPATGGLTANVRAIRAGVTKLSAAGGAICQAGQPCPLFLVGWQLTVTVT